VAGIDEARMGGAGRIDVGVGVLREDVEGNGDDRGAERLDLVVQCLPTWQGEAAASIRRPGDQHHLATTE